MTSVGQPWVSWRKARASIGSELYALRTIHSSCPFLPQRALGAAQVAYIGPKITVPPNLSVVECPRLRWTGTGTSVTRATGCRDEFGPERTLMLFERKGRGCRDAQAQAGLRPLFDEHLPRRPVPRPSADHRHRLRRRLRRPLPLQPQSAAATAPPRAKFAARLAVMTLTCCRKVSAQKRAAASASLSTKRRSCSSALPVLSLWSQIHASFPLALSDIGARSVFCTSEASSFDRALHKV